MTENLNLTSACLQHLQQTSPSSSPVEILDSTRVDSISLGPETTDFDLTSWPVITTSTGRKLAARLLVGADGANSPVRTFAEIETRGWDYGRFGVVATLKLAEAEKVKKAWQRFLPSGPVAFLPVGFLSHRHHRHHCRTTVDGIYVASGRFRDPRLVHDPATRSSPQVIKYKRHDGNGERGFSPQPG